MFSLQNGQGSLHNSMSTPPISLEELLAKRRQQQEESQRVI